jgi:hypothetical protein
VDALDQNVEGLRAHLQHLVTITRKYCHSGNLFCEHGQQLSSALMNLHGESWFTRLGPMAPALVRFGETLDEIQNYVEALLLSLETTFSAPMEEFVKREVKFIRKMKIEVSRASEDYEAHLQRFLQLKRNSEESQVQLRAAEVAATRRRFELSRFDLVHHLNQLETKKKFQLVERVCSALYAFLGYFHQCHTLVANLEPSMRDLHHSLQLARKDFAKDDRLWTAKRMQLELKLNRFVEVGDGPIMEPGSSSGGPSGNSHRRLNSTSSARHMGSGGWSNALPSPPDTPRSGNAGLEDMLSSDDEGEARPCECEDGSDAPDTPLQRGESAKGGPSFTSFPVKSGYLWKRSSSVRKDWKRRYFLLQSGKLYYQRQELTVSPPVLVCDVKLCTVRACDKENDFRFSFEIISPKQRTYVLQAEDEQSHQAWIDAIRVEIERQLCAGSSRRTSSTAERRSPSMSIQAGNVVNRLMRINPVCADCGASSPDWASINLGAMMCIECSGAHRSMGVHVSKVRSLNLDRWTMPLLQLMERVGNRRLNDIWEAACQPEERISPDADYASREAFIRRKYVQREFLSPSLDASPEAVQEAGRILYDAALLGDMEGVMNAIARGADVNWANAQEEMATPVHQAVRGSQLLVLEYLSQNGATLDAVTEIEEAPLDIAMRNEDQEIMALLVNKLEKARDIGSVSSC